MTGALARKRLRALLAGDHTTMMASVFDPISSRLAEQIGYETALVGGSLVSHAVLGAPDLILITLTELAEQIHRCARASNVALVVDGDHGYGNALSVMRTVRELDDAGAGAVMIEDTVLPRQYGPPDKGRLLSTDESTAKMAAAVAARGDSDIVVMARTSAASVTGVDEAIARFTAYEQTGVDALFLPGVASRADLDRIAAATRLPLVIGGVSRAVIEAPGVGKDRTRLWSPGHTVFAIAVAALRDAMQKIHDGVDPRTLLGPSDAAQLDQALDSDGYAALSKRFLGG